MATGGGGGADSVTNQPSKGMSLLLPKPTTYTCDICGQEGLNEDDMKTHVLLEHVEGGISCPFCDLEGTTVEEMNLHVNSQHLDFSAPYDKENEEDLISSSKETSKVAVNDTLSTDNSTKESQTEKNTTSLSNSKQDLNLLNSQKQNESAKKEKQSSNKESIESYMPLQEIRNASEVSMDTASSCQSNNTSTSCSPESEISLGNRETSSENNNSSSYEASSSCSTTPEERDTQKPSQQITVREIKINVIKDSPKKVISSEVVDLKMGSDGEEQSRKRAKLYLHVPQPHSPRRQINPESSSATRAPSLLDSHASTAQLHRFAQLTSPKFPSHHGIVGLDDLVETDGADDTPEDSEDSTGASDIFTCPLCSWNTRSPGAIVRHVNTDHLDVISPSAHPQRPSVAPSTPRPIATTTTDTENNVLSAKPGTSSSTSSPQFACPICNLDAKTGSSLELHVNSEHAELLSPAKPLQPQVSDYLFFSRLLVSV